MRDDALYVQEWCHSQCFLPIRSGVQVSPFGTLPLLFHWAVAEMRSECPQT
jgi:hypothetical protein